MLDQSFILIDGKAVDVGRVLSQLDHGNLADYDFRKFLDDLESTPFGEYSSPICERLFLFVKNNLGVQDHEELVALGCAIRKLVFNFKEQEFPQVAELLCAARNFRLKEGCATNVEKMLCKALMDRFEYSPIKYRSSFTSINEQLLLLIKELGPGLSTKNSTTRATFLGAMLAFLCYANPSDVDEYSFDFTIPNSTLRLLRSLGEDIQKAIDKKITEERLRPRILDFIQRLEKEKE